MEITLNENEIMIIKVALQSEYMREYRKNTRNTMVDIRDSEQYMKDMKTVLEIFEGLEDE